MSQLVSELRHAARGLLREPGFTVVVVLTLGLGIGATTAVFSLLHGVVLAPLPYPDPDRLVWIGHVAPGIDFQGDIEMSRGFYRPYREGSDTLEEIGLWRNRQRTLTERGDPVRLDVSEATASLFAVLGARPLHGRLLQEADEQPGGERMAVLSHGLWQGRFGGDPGVVGSVLRLDGRPVTVVGVLEPGFRSPEPATQLWLDAGPIDFDSFGGFNARAVARMRPGVGLDDVARDLDARLAEIKDAEPQTGALLEDARVAAWPAALQDHVVGDVERTLWIVMGSAAFVLLVACANVAGLLLVRAEDRQRERAVRTALGATRGRLAAQPLAESALLAVAGSGLGVAAAFLSVRALVARAPVSIPRLDAVGIDPVALAFAALLAVLAAVLFGLVPALRPASGVAAALRDGSRGATAGRARVRLRHGLVVAQVSVALVLVVGASLMAGSFWRLARVDPGFDGTGVLTFELSLPSSRYEESRDAAAFHHVLLERLAALPGVTHAGAALRLPLRGPIGGNIVVDETDPPEPGTLPPIVWVNRATEGYFQALAIPLLSGRLLTRADDEPDVDAAIANRALAELYWPGADPLGRQLTFNPEVDPVRVTIAGVVGTTRMESLTEDPQPMLYAPMLGGHYEEAHRMSYAVRASVPPLSLAGAVQQAVWEMDDSLAVVRLTPMDDIVAGARAPTVFTMVLLAAAALVALLLGSIGVYGAIAWLVSRRIPEIGVRLALGARAADIHRMLLWRGAAIAAAGLGAGLVASLALVRLMEPLVYGIDPLDPATHLGSAAVLLVAVLLATWIPARRAASIDPQEALRPG